MPKDKPKTRAVRKYKKRTPKLNHQLSRILRSRKFSPLNAILDELPSLEPKDRVAAYFKIMAFLYPVPKAVDTEPRKKKGPGIQTNVQVNLPSENKEQPAPQTHQDIVKLLEAAEKKDD